MEKKSIRIKELWTQPLSKINMILYFAFALGTVNLFITLSSLKESFLVLTIPLSILYTLLSIMIMGVIVKYAHTTLKSDKQPLEINVWEDFLKGIELIALYIIWFLAFGLGFIGISLPILVIFWLIGKIFSFSIVAQNISVGLLFILGMLLLGLFSYVAPLIATSYIKKIKFKDGLKFREVFKKAFTMKYFTSYLKYLFVSLVTLVLVFIPLILLVGIYGEVILTQENALEYLIKQNIINLFIVIAYIFYEEFISAYMLFIFGYFISRLAKILR